jgi:hypothetical protein
MKWGHSLTRVAGSNLCQSKVSYKLALVAIQVHLCKPELAERPVRRKAVGSKSGTNVPKGIDSRATLRS